MELTHLAAIMSPSDIAVLELEEHISPEHAAELRKQWTAAWQGLEQRPRLIVLEPGVRLAAIIKELVRGGAVGSSAES